ncbi:hypothetical protein [Paenibacillus zanthoxyli]|uniref:hypothetical protein n=1 Tax=Paenibacillus zanthoxyli TaxID=369399 RepID=UPI0004725D45|nr:hypothetical protein [Paenibacillus zanthoxyli]
MPLWGDAPRIAAPQNTQDIAQVLAYVKNLANTVALMAKDLEFIVNGNLDVNNISANSITAEKIVAGSVTAEKIQAGAVTADKIQAGAVTANKIDVDELSAISANLGTITAGLIQSIQIFGSYIATRNGGYPRAEMNNTEDLLATYFDLNNYIKYVSNYAGAPAIEFVAGGALRGRIDTIFGNLEIYGPNGIDFASGGRTIFDNWDQIYNLSDNRTLLQELTEIWDRLENLENDMALKSNIGHTHTVTTPDHNHGNPANATSGGGTFPTSP